MPLEGVHPLRVAGEQRHAPERGGVGRGGGGPRAVVPAHVSSQRQVPVCLLCSSARRALISHLTFWAVSGNEPLISVGGTLQETPGWSRHPFLFAVFARVVQSLDPAVKFSQEDPRHPDQRGGAVGAFASPDPASRPGFPASGRPCGDA